MHNSPYVVALILAAAVHFVLAASGFRLRHVPGALPFGITMLLSGFWDLVYAFEVGASSPEVKILAQQLQFPALAGVPVCLFWMSLEYTGRKQWLTRARAVALLVIPVASGLSGILARQRAHFAGHLPVEGAPPLDVIPFIADPFFLIHVIYSNCLLLAMIILLGSSLPGTPPVYRMRTLILIASILLPTITNALFIAGISPVRGYNISPGVTVFTGLLLAWGVFRLRLIELVPIARTTVIDNLSDSVIVLDSQDHVVDMNPAAQQAFGVCRSEVVGKPVEAAFERWNAIRERLRDTSSGTGEVTLSDEQGSRTYQMTLSPIKDQGAACWGACSCSMT